MKVNVFEDGEIRIVPFEESEPWVELTPEQEELLNKCLLGYKNGQLVDLTAHFEAQEEIYECLQYLKSTDYIASKLAEANSKYIESGDNSEVIALRQHYATELETRESKRVRIRELENI